MRTTTYVRQLNHEPAIVSTFLADLCNDKKWREEVLQTELVSGTSGEPDAEYRETLTWEGLYAPASLTVASVEEGSRLVIVARDPEYKAVYEYSFSPIGQGTDLTLVATMNTTGALRLVEPFLWALINRWLERGLDALDGVLKDEGARRT